jgi:seryl-tRNA synthetase
VWQWVTTEIKPVLGEANTTLIALIDRIRMLDNDMIRLNTKLKMIQELQNKSNKEIADKVKSKK